ncbi:MAG: Gfo/Idh/MocA family protein [Flavobacteriaceae bacterium]
MMKTIFTFVILSIATFVSVQYSEKTAQSQEKEEPFKIAVVGMDHGHVHQILRRGKTGDLEIVGFVEANRDLAERLTKQYGYSVDLIFETIDEMLAATKPEAVTAFNSTFGHLETVRKCAPKGIHVMVEKPLAVSWEHAKEMKSLAEKHKIHLLTNYETTWYGSNHEAYKMMHEEDKIGELRRIVFHTGHPGPIEIGCDSEFLEWLTDPVLNGAGALTDFGCYGANLTSWLLKGEHPESVTCMTRQFKPEKYPKVDDDASIILNYPNTQVIIQASWNWPHNVKDMEVYGTTGYIFCKNGTDMQLLENEKDGSFSKKADALPLGLDDPFALLRKIVQDGYELPSNDLTSLENNLLVVQILEAAKRSAETGKTIFWNDLFPSEK